MAEGISSRVLLQEFAPLRRQFWGRHVWARGYLAVSSGNLTDDMIQEYIDEQEGEPVADNSRFQIDRRTPRLIGEGCSVAGADTGGERAAAMYTLIGTAELSGLNPEAYLRHVLTRIAELRVSRINDLLPWNVRDVIAAETPPLDPGGRVKRWRADAYGSDSCHSKSDSAIALAVDAIPIDSH